MQGELSHGLMIARGQAGSLATFLRKSLPDTWNTMGFTGPCVQRMVRVRRGLTCRPCRYLNNPEVMSGAAFFGLALISGSKLVFALAVVRHLSQWWFMSKVEK